MRTLPYSLFPALVLAACGVDRDPYANPDASRVDGGGDPIDAEVVPDAADPDANVPDAGPGATVVVDGQSAELVLGQPNFNTETENTGGISGASLKSISGLASNGSSLWAMDLANCRALRFDPMPTGSAEAADLALGSTALTATDCVGASASDFGMQGEGPHAAISGTKLVVTDSFYNRVVIWNPLPTTNGQAANIVLGQTSFGPISSGNSSSKLSRPRGVWTDGTRLVVADTANHRVLIWTTFPTSNGEAADLVLGQTGFDLSTAPTSPTATNMNGPTGVYSDGTRLYVADRGQNRVLVWNTFPTSNNEAADYAIGQPDLTTGTAGTSATTLRSPQSIAIAGNALFVADELNDRILVYTPIPTASGAAAAHVLGHDDFTTGGGTTAASQEALDNPIDLVVVGDKLYVADMNNRRILRFGLNLP